MRARCDPVDTAAVRKALGEGVPMLRLYREYASTAARPYARSSWDQLIKIAKRKKGDGLHLNGLPVDEMVRSADAPSAVEEDAASDAHWGKRLQVKPRILTTVADNAILRVKGGALIVCDGDERLVYEPGGRKPQAIVMTGWSGSVTIEAMRWACDQRVTIIVVLDWMRDFLTIVAPPAKTNATFIRAQVCADPKRLLVSSWL
jgi:hypothetical protein